MPDFETIAAPFPPEANRAERLALRVLQVGAIAVVIVVSTLHIFELDRFFVPKELAFHLTAVVAGLLLIHGNFFHFQLGRKDKPVHVYQRHIVCLWIFLRRVRKRYP